MTRGVRIFLLAAAMIAVIIAMVASYARDLHGGTEFRLRTEPVDPRSLFLGHYATLSYAINRLEGEILAGHCYASNDAIYVTLEEGAEGWRATRTAPQMSGDGFAAGRVTLRGRVVFGDCGEPEEDQPPASLFVNYGIEQYFASPDAARRLEDLGRRMPPPGEDEAAAEPLIIILSAPRSGRALIKGVVIDGVDLYDQTIW